MEQARGDNNNIVTSVMHEFDTDVNSAILWVADHLTELEKKVLETMATVPKWGEPIDSQVKQYCDGMGNWVRAFDEWGFESKRYFGANGLEVKRKRWVLLMEKDSWKSKGVGPVFVD